MKLLSESVALESKAASYPFRILATKYTFRSNPYGYSDDAYTLIFMHALGVHRETWEITIARLFTLSVQGDTQVKIRDVFSVESPDHGRSAVINADALKNHSDHNCELSGAASEFPC